jgi:membrane protein YdbS with pleckstrin-like domain
MGDSTVAWIKNLVFPLLKIESITPNIPNGHENDKFLRVLRADESYWHYLLLGWWVYAVFWVFGICVGIVTTFIVAPLFAWLVIPISFIGLAKSVVLFVVIRIDYELRWYIITDTSITVRQGAWTVREITVSYQNIQNVRVSQGPLERFFGFANLQIDTAGSAGIGAHGKGGSPNQAVLRGIRNATQIRDIILENLRTFRNSGLGDPDDLISNTIVDEDIARIEILQQIADEVLRLRQAAE